MGGEIKVESQEGQGSTFSFYIQTEAEFDDKTIDNQYFIERSEQLAGQRWLISGFSPLNYSLISALLRSWGAMVYDREGEEPLSGILAEYQNQGDFVQLLALRQMHAGARIFLAHSPGEIRQQEWQALCAGFVSKPVKPSHLLETLTVEQHIISSPVNPSESNTYTAAPLSILIAEDNTVNQHLLKTMLLKMGYEADLVENGREAVEAAKQKLYQLIFMDVQMPEMDGLEATRVIRAQLPYQPVIVAMTANAMQGDQEMCLEAGMNDYVSKPFRRAELERVVKEVSERLKC
jgi:CheY-like chemotaxis protein